MNENIFNLHRNKFVSFAPSSVQHIAVCADGSLGAAIRSDGSI